MNLTVLKRLLLYWYRINSVYVTFLLTYEIVMCFRLPLSVWVYRELSEFSSAVEVIIFEQLLLSLDFWLSSWEERPEPHDCIYCSAKSP